MSNVAFASASANNNTSEALQIPAIINWGAMTGGEIYDKFHEKGSKRGIMANRILKEAIDRGFFPGNAGTKLTKTKLERTVQRKFFHEVSQEGIQFIRIFFADSDKDEEENLADTQLLSASEISANLK